MTTFDQTGSQPRVVQIAEVLQQQISAGQLQPGDQLPTEAQLCQKFNVSRSTLRESIRMLRARGFVEVAPGRGSFVRQPAPDELIQSMGGGACMALSYQPQEVYRLLVMVIMSRLRDVPLDKVAQAVAHLSIVNPARDAQENLLSEQQWFTGLLHTEFNTVTHFFTGLLYQLTAQERLKLMADSAAVQRLMTLQIRLHAALKDKDLAQVERLLVSYFTAVPQA